MRLCRFISAKFYELVANKAGNFAMGFALLAPLLLGVTGGAVDLVNYNRLEARMQDIADAAVLAATKEGSLQGWDQVIAKAVAVKFVEDELQSGSSSKFLTDALLDKSAKRVTVTVSMDHHPFFYVGYFTGSPQITVTSSASMSSDMNICVIGLDPVDPATVSLTGKSRLMAPNCAIFSNSQSASGFASVEDAYLKSDQNCSAGGATGTLKNYAVMPTTDCPALPDPLANRKLPDSSVCKYNNTVVKGFVTILNPGVYCGGITITDKANVLFKPGIYVIKDGELKSSKGGIAAGKDVAFFFTGEGSRYAFDSTTTIGFVAPRTGDLAGLLFFQDPNMKTTLVYEISSIKAGLLLGTIYLPNGIFKVHAKNSIGEESAYTVIVAKKIDIGAEAELVVNSNYSATTVPVPDGLGPSSNLRLTN